MQSPTMHLTRLLLPLLVVGFSLPGVARAETVLRYSDHEPFGGMRTRYIKDVFFDAIERESKGRLKIEDHWDSKVSTGYDALGIVGKGSAADMAVVVPEYTAKELPLQQIFKSFPLGPSGEQQVSFFRRAYAQIPEYHAELNRNNVVPLLFATGYPVAFFSTKPFNTLKDIEATKWRTASFWHSDFIRNAGATPVSMLWGDGVFKALQARTLDGLMVNVDSGFMLKVHETAPDVLLSKSLWLGHVYPLVMNRTKWNALPKEDQDAIQRAAEVSYRSLGRLMDTSFDAMVQDLKNAGAKVRILDGAELNTWGATTQYQKAQAKWVQEQEAGGLGAAGSVMERTRSLMNEAMQ